MRKPLYYSCVSRSIDNLGTNVISQEEFRAAIESRFQLTLNDDQFDSFIDRVPLDEEGNVRYSEFMQQFDTRYVVSVVNTKTVVF